MKKIAVKSWTRMWKSPTMTTFAGEFEDNYDGPILEFWESQLNGKFNRVIDLACGNGALTWIANDLLNSGETKTAVTGVDFADIAPFTALKRKEQDFPEVSFIGNTNIENLPFEDGAVDLAISQYGLEYSDFDKSIPEISRVLSSTGKMCFIMHDRRSVHAMKAIHPLDDFRTLRDVIRFDELILELGEAHEKNRSAQALSASGEYQNLMERIEATRSDFHSIVDKHPDDPHLSAYKTSLERAFREASKKPKNRQLDLQKIVTAKWRELCAAIEHKEDLIAASLSGKERDHLVALIRREGFIVTEDRVLEQKKGSVWGAILVAERTPTTDKSIGFLRRWLAPLISVVASEAKM